MSSINSEDPQRRVSLIIDKLGHEKVEWKLKDFTEYYERNKEELDKIHSHRINSHVKIVDDDGNEYKVQRRQGKTKLIRTSLSDKYTKRDMLASIIELTNTLSELKKLLDKDDGTDPIKSIQDKTPIKKYRV